MSAKNGTCQNDYKRAVGIFDGKKLCVDCRPYTPEQRERHLLRDQRREQEREKAAAYQTLLDKRAEKHRVAEEIERLQEVENEGESSGS